MAQLLGLQPQSPQLSAPPSERPQCPSAPEALSGRPTLPQCPRARKCPSEPPERPQCPPVQELERPSEPPSEPPSAPETELERPSERPSAPPSERPSAPPSAPETELEPPSAPETEPQTFRSSLPSAPEMEPFPSGPSRPTPLPELIHRLPAGRGGSPRARRLGAQGFSLRHVGLGGLHAAVRSPLGSRLYGFASTVGPPEGSGLCVRYHCHDLSEARRLPAFSLHRHASPRFRRPPLSAARKVPPSRLRRHCRPASKVPPASAVAFSPPPASRSSGSASAAATAASRAVLRLRRRLPKGSSLPVFAAATGRQRVFAASLPATREFGLTPSPPSGLRRFCLRRRRPEGSCRLWRRRRPPEGPNLNAVFWRRRRSPEGPAFAFACAVAAGHHSVHVFHCRRRLQFISCQTPNSTMAKTKELSKDTRNKIVDLHQAGKTESAIVDLIKLSTKNYHHVNNLKLWRSEFIDILVQDNNFHLKVSKTKALMVTFRKRQREEHAPIQQQDYSGESQQLQVPQGSYQT
ncbi:hypothetical protein L3Q82_004215 [Scortum barcoo]|uniref:Uncharacterized protein n=1 Tax=Scortum barcoo TaxID=214431 RepID=A0ACB8VJC5_9TELE|nr:hypothetical protein L3Q82_004215 [Scortum barcoo]